METVAATITGGRRSFPGWTSILFISKSFSFYFTQQEEQHPLSHYHAIYGFLLPNLLNFLKLKYQGLDSTPFETHPKTMSISIASLLMYSLAYDYELRLYSIPSHTRPAYANVVLCGAVVLGSLSLVSLASVILPKPIRPVLFLLDVLFSARLMVNFRLVQVLWNCIKERMRGNLVRDLNTQQRCIEGPLIDPSSSVAHQREGTRASGVRVRNPLS